MTNERLYEIAGELRTMQQIQELCPDVNPHTLSSRVRSGVRDLAKLRAPASRVRFNHPWKTPRPDKSKR